MSRLVRLYPDAWQERYGAEFAGLLEDRPPSLVDRFDIARAALDAHLHPQVARPGASPPMPDDGTALGRRLGFGVLLGAALWITAFAVAMLGPVAYDGDGAYRDGSAAAPWLFGAACFIAGGLGGHLIGLPRRAHLARAGAGTALLCLVVWAVQPWFVWAGALMLGGLAVLAMDAYRVRAWPGSTSAAVFVPCLIVGGMIGVGYAFEADRMTGATLFSVAGATLMPAWLSVGTALLRRAA